MNAIIVEGSKVSKRGGKAWTPEQYEKYNATIAARKAAPAVSGVKVLNHGKISFDVVDSSNLPVDFDFRIEGKYRELFSEAASLSEGKVIVVNCRTAYEMHRIYNTLMYRIKHDGRFSGLEARQRLPKLFVFRAQK